MDRWPCGLVSDAPMEQIEVSAIGPARMRCASISRVAVLAWSSALSSFSDPQAVARYAQGPVKQVPGFHALQQMTTLLLAEAVAREGSVLVLGAGGGLELKVFAEAQPEWRFVGVDPSHEMLKLASETLGPLASRIELCEGYIDTAPVGPFDGATCLLTLHFARRGTPADADRTQATTEARRAVDRGPPQRSRRSQAALAQSLCGIRGGVRRHRRAGRK